MKKFNWMVFLTIIFCSSLAKADFGTGIDLLKKCEAAKEVIEDKKIEKSSKYSEAMYCLGLLQGILDTEAIHQVMDKEQLLCFENEKGIQVQQAVYIVTKYLQDTPTQLHRNQSLLAISALMESAMCK